MPGSRFIDQGVSIHHSNSQKFTEADRKSKMTFTKKPMRSASGDLSVSELAGSETELLVWKPNEKVSFNVPERWSHLKAIMLSIPISLAVGVVAGSALGQTPGRWWLVAVTSCTLTCVLAFCWFRQPKMNITIDWKNQTLLIQRSFLNSLIFGSAPFVSQRHPFASIKTIFIQPTKESTHYDSDSENFVASLSLEFSTGNPVEIIPMFLSQETVSEACKSLGRIARLFSQAFDAPIKILDLPKRDLREAESNTTDLEAFYFQEIEEDPSNVGAYIGLGKHYLEAFDNENAIKFFSTALEVEPDNLEVFRYRAKAYYEMADDLDPNPSLNPVGHTPVKFLKAAISDLTLPISKFETLQDPREIDFECQCEDLTARGKCFSALGQHQNAIDDFSRCLALQENDKASSSSKEMRLHEVSSTLGYRAQAYLDSRNGELAAADINKAIEICPESLEWHQGLRGEIRKLNGDFSAAEKDIEQSKQRYG